MHHMQHGQSEVERRSARRRVRRCLALVASTAVAAALALPASPSGAIVAGTNGKIAFESSRDGNNEIYVMNHDGTIETNLTNDPSSDVFPAWSPDATKITFSSDRAQPGNADVYVMNADGTGVTRLTNAPGEDRGTSWTSDGQKIVFHSARLRDVTHTFDVFVMNADGSNQQRIFVNGSAAYVCGDSVNGRIVFNSNQAQPNDIDVTGDGIPDRDFDIYTMDMDGSDVVNVTDNTIFDSGPKWSPDCSTISYNSIDAGGSLDIFRINADGTGRVNLTNAPGIFDAFSAWSPDGSRIVFSSNRDVNFELYTMNATDGSDVQRFTFTKRGEADLRPDWGTAPSTYGPPTQKNQCKNGGWAEFQTPTFADQGECVTYVQEGS